MSVSTESYIRYDIGALVLWVRRINGAATLWMIFQRLHHNTAFVLLSFPFIRKPSLTGNYRKNIFFIAVFFYNRAVVKKDPFTTHILSAKSVM